MLVNPFELRLVWYCQLYKQKNSTRIVFSLGQNNVYRIYFLEMLVVTKF